MVGGFLQDRDQLLHARNDAFLRAPSVGGIAQMQSGEFGRSCDHVVPEQSRVDARRVERPLSGRQLADIGERLSGLKQQARPVRVPLVENADRPLEQARSSGHVTTVDRP